MMKAWQLTIPPSWDPMAKKLHGKVHVINQDAKMTAPAELPGNV